MLTYRIYLTTDRCVHGFSGVFTYL